MVRKPDIDGLAKSHMTANIKQELRRGALVNALGVVGKISGPAFLIVVNRLYGGDVFGVFITAAALVQMAIAFLTAGFKDATLMFVARHAGDPEDHRLLYGALANSLAWSLLFSVVLIVLTIAFGPALLPGLFDYGDRLLTMLSWMVLVLPLMAFDHIVSAATQGLRIMKYEALMNGGVRPLALLLLSAGCYLISPDVRGLTLAYVGTQVIAAVFAIFIFRRELEWRRLWRASRTFRVNREMIGFALPQNLNLALDRFLTNIDVLMLGFFGVSAGMVGFYGPAALFVRELRQIKLIFSSAFAPHIVRLHRRGEIRQLASTLADTSRWIATLAVPALLALAILRRDLLAVVSPAFAGMDALFMLLLLPIPYLQCSLGLAGNTVVMTGHSRLNLANNVATGAINVALNLWLIPLLGLPGAAIASSLSLVVKAVLEVSEMYYIVGVPLLARRLYKPHLAGLLAVAGLFALSLLYSAPIAGSVWYRLALTGVVLTAYGALLTLLMGRLPRLPQ